MNALVRFALIALISFAASAQDGQVTLDFDRADLASVITKISEITGKNFIVDPRVKGEITLVSARPVSREHAYEIFLSALRMNGFTTIESVGVIKIIPEAEAKQNRAKVVGKAGGANSDRMVTMVYPLEFESAAQLAPILRPLIAPNNAVAALPGANVLVISDYASNLSRISRIIEAIDRAEGGDIAVIPLVHASAVDLAQILSKIGGDSAAAAGQGARQKLSVAADARGNSLIVRAESTAALERIKEFVSGIDVPVTDGGGIHVVHLRHAEAAPIAEILRALLAGDAKPLQTSQATSGPVKAPLKTPAEPVADPQPELASIQGSVASVTGQGGLVVADPASNSLVIAAPDSVYRSLVAIVSELDLRREQIYLEALIAEVSSSLTAEFGIQFQAISNLDSGVFGGTNFSTTPGANIIAATVNPASVGPGLNIGVVRGTITIGGVEVLNFAALARALERDTQANVLSTPSLLTLDNEEAKIVVGQNIPFVSGSFAQSIGTDGAVNPFQTIERRDIGLTLRIKPRIADDGTLSLKIFQEVSSIAALPTALTADVITNKRSIESTVLLDDGAIAVIGGTIEDSVTSNVDKVPLLGDIPIIGHFFRYESRSRSKTNLMVFLRPVVLRSAEASAPVTYDRYNNIREQQKPTPSHPVLPENPAPRLPWIDRAPQ